MLKAIEGGPDALTILACKMQLESEFARLAPGFAHILQVNITPEPDDTFLLSLTPTEGYSEADLDLARRVCNYAAEQEHRRLN